MVVVPLEMAISEHKMEKSAKNRHKLTDKQVSFVDILH